MSVLSDLAWASVFAIATLAGLALLAVGIYCLVDAAVGAVGVVLRWMSEGRRGSWTLLGVYVTVALIVGAVLLFGERVG